MPGAVGKGIACQIDGRAGIVKLDVISVLIGVVFDDRVILGADLTDNDRSQGLTLATPFASVFAE